MDTKRIPQTEEEHEVCFHCLNTGWVMLTSEDCHGELEDYYYFVLWRKCEERSERFGGCTRITRGRDRRREMRMMMGDTPSDRRAPTI